MYVKVNTKPFLVSIVLLHIPIILPVVNLFKQIVNNFSWLDLLGLILYCITFGISLPYNFYKVIEQEINEKIQKLILKHGRTIKAKKWWYIYLHIYTILYISSVLVIISAILYLFDKNFIQQLKFYGILILITLPIVLFNELND